MDAVRKVQRVLVQPLLIGVSPAVAVLPGASRETRLTLVEGKNTVCSSHRSGDSGALERDKGRTRPILLSERCHRPAGRSRCVGRH